MLYKLKTFLKSNKVGRAIYEPIGYIYRKYYKDPQRLRQMKKYGYETLRYIMEISEKEGWDVIPIFGTLLGFIREGDFIKHDNDIDLAVAPGHDPKQMAQTLVEKYGLKFGQALSYHGKVTEFSVEHHGISIDFFSLKKKKIRQEFLHIFGTAMNLIQTHIKTMFNLYTIPKLRLSNILISKE